MTVSQHVQELILSRLKEHRCTRPQPAHRRALLRGIGGGAAGYSAALKTRGVCA